MKKLTAKKAKELLDEANRMNPGGWYDHSIWVGKAAHKIAEALGEDADKAEAFGYIHDVGRRVGRCQLKHIFEGYKYLTELGYDEAARICLTHSFFVPQTEGVIGKWDMSEEEKKFVEDYINNTEFDMYDKIVQMADSIAISTGIVILERRMVDVFFRYGFDEYTEFNLRIRLNLQAELEEKIGYPIYRLFKDELVESLSNSMVSKVVRFKQ